MFLIASNLTIATAVKSSQYYLDTNSLDLSKYEIILRQTNKLKEMEEKEILVIDEFEEFKAKAVLESIDVKPIPAFVITYS